jgi:hypothetical protein
VINERVSASGSSRAAFWAISVERVETADSSASLFDMANLILSSKIQSGDP